MRRMGRRGHLARRGPSAVTALLLAVVVAWTGDALGESLLPEESTTTTARPTSVTSTVTVASATVATRRRSTTTRPVSTTLPSSTTTNTAGAIATPGEPPERLTMFVAEEGFLPPAAEDALRRFGRDRLTYEALAPGAALNATDVVVGIRYIGGLCPTVKEIQEERGLLLASRALSLRVVCDPRVWSEEVGAALTRTGQLELLQPKLEWDERGEGQARLKLRYALPAGVTVAYRLTGHAMAGFTSRVDQQQLIVTATAGYGRLASLIRLSITGSFDGEDIFRTATQVLVETRPAAPTPRGGFPGLTVGLAVLLFAGVVGAAVVVVRRRDLGGHLAGSGGLAFAKTSGGSVAPKPYVLTGLRPRNGATAEAPSTVPTAEAVGVEELDALVGAAAAGGAVVPGPPAEAESEPALPQPEPLYEVLHVLRQARPPLPGQAVAAWHATEPEFVIATAPSDGSLPPALAYPDDHHPDDRDRAWPLTATRVRPEPTPHGRVWAWSGKATLGLAVYTEQRAGLGEDAEPTLIVPTKGDGGFVAVYDGLGGAGSAPVGQLEDGTPVTQAFVASRFVREVIEGWYVNRRVRELATGTPISARIVAAGLAHAIATFRERFVRDSGSAVSSSLQRILPTTMAVIEATRVNRQYLLQAMWAGDSRAYVLTPGAGLQQLSLDHVRKPDPFEQLINDSPMSNVICADGFTLDHAQVWIAGAHVAICATDGVFGYVGTPGEVEVVLLQTLAAAANLEDWGARLASRFVGYTGDDATVAILASGWKSFGQLRESFKERLAEVVGSQAEPMRAAGSDRDAVTAARAAAWNTYMESYMALAPAAKARRS